MCRELTYTCDRCKTRVVVATDKLPQDWSRLLRWSDNVGTTIERDFDLCAGCSVAVDVALEGLADATE